MKKEKEKRFPASGRRNPFLKGEVRGSVPVPEGMGSRSRSGIRDQGHSFSLRDTPSDTGQISQGREGIV